MYAHLYQNIVLKNPKSIFLLLIIVLLSFGFFSKDFRLDASSETLLINGDPDLKYLQEINDELKFFKEIITFDHPRFIMQYRLKKLDTYLKKYTETLNRILT